MANIITRIIDSELNRKASGIVGRFFIRIAWVFSALAIVFMIGRLAHAAFQGNPVITGVIEYFGWKAAAFAIICGWLGNSLAKTDDPEYREAEQALREIRKRYGI